MFTHISRSGSGVRLIKAALSFFLIASSWAQGANNAIEDPDLTQAAADLIILPEPVPDPLEAMNRVIWGFNKALMAGVVKPTARVYRFVVRRPIRIGIGNFGRNITYPVRLLNNVLQARWAGARDETYRFGVNTFVGVGGVLDVASWWKIPKADADFGQTLGHWGWHPQCFLMLPIYGPSNERDTIGLAADSAANPLTYLSPYPFVGSKPLTYLSPYTYYSYAVMYNNLSDSVDGYVRFTKTEMDPYSEVEYAWSFVRDVRPVDFQVQNPPDEAALESLQSVFLTLRDPDFPRRGKTETVRIPSTGKILKFSCWLQRGPEPLVYLVPGLGSHRLTGTVLGLAELLYRNGLSVVTISNPFNYEFMEAAATAGLPAYPPVDARDVHVALTQIDGRLRQQRHEQLGPRVLMGYSMGGFYTLYLAGTANREPSLIPFDRYVAIDTPVDLLHGLSKLDEFYDAPLAWPAAERTSKIENTFLKVAALNAGSRPSVLPLSGIESRFLVGVAFRLVLRDVIFDSQQHHNQGILKHQISLLRREPIYREVLQYSYNDYFDQFVLPYYQNRGIAQNLTEALDQSGNLRTHAAALGQNPNIRVMVNANDFLLAPEDMQWLRDTFGPNRLTVFPNGGHLGNLGQPEVQQAMVKAAKGEK
jgi:ABC-type transporter lipoprotein component MlaA